MGGEGGSKSFPLNDRKESRRPKVTLLTASLSLTLLLAHKNAHMIFFFPLFKFLLTLMLVTTFTFKLSVLMIGP